MSSRYKTAASGLWVSRLFLVAMLGLILLAVLLPGPSIGWMRHRWDWFTYPLDIIEHMGSAVNLVHAILFLLLGIAMGLALPRWRAGRVMAALLLLGAATELVQVLVPGRHARLSDVLVDVVAGLLGWAALWSLARL